MRSILPSKLLATNLVQCQLHGSYKLPNGWQQKCLHLSTEQPIKPYDEIPMKTGLLPASLSFLLSGGPGYLHEYCDRRHKELGRIFRERLGSNELVFIADTKLFQTTIANEGIRPHHSIPEAWIHYNRAKNIDRGLFFQVGEPWSKIRRAFNKVMLTDPKSITRFSEDILKINSDLLKSWTTMNSCRSDDEIVIDDVKTDLCRWSIESTGFMLFGNRMGCVSDSTNSELKAEELKARELVRNVANMFSETSRFQVLPVKLAHRFNLRPWRRFEQASDNMLRLAREYTSEFISKAKQINSRPSLVSDLLTLGTLSDDEISRSLVDLIIAAADTTSNSLQWMLYLVAKYKYVQLKLLEEVEQLFQVPSRMQNLNENAPYLKAFVKEAARLYPTAPFLARTLDHDIVLDRYKIPARVPIVLSLYTTSRMDKYFDQPLEFRPERWMRIGHGTNCPNNHAYASLPFGIGARKCIGHRAADLEMCLFIASFVKEFESSLFNCEDVNIKLKMVLCPDKPISLKLKRRK